MLNSFLDLELNKRLGLFLIVASALGFASLWLSVKIVYPDGAVPQLKGYCCEYCENGTECVRAAIGDPGASKEEVCANIGEHKTDKGTAIDVPIAPSDTWSNVAYIVIALLPLAQRVRTNSAAILFTIVTIILGFGSGLFHAAGTHNGELADVFGMFLAFGFLAAYSVLVWLDKKNIFLLIVLTAAFTWMEFFLRSASGDVLALGLIAAIILIPLAISSKGTPYQVRVLWSLLIFVVAIIFRQLDHYFCGILGEHSFIQGHAIWHVISALGIGYVFWLQQEITEEEIKRDFV